jgi:hypothetical protein
MSDRSDTRRQFLVVQRRTARIEAGKLVKLQSRPAHNKTTAGVPFRLVFVRTGLVGLRMSFVVFENSRVNKRERLAIKAKARCQCAALSKGESNKAPNQRCRATPMAVNHS